MMLWRVGARTTIAGTDITAELPRHTDLSENGRKPERLATQCEWLSVGMCSSGNKGNSKTPMEQLTASALLRFCTLRSKAEL